MTEDEISFEMINDDYNKTKEQLDSIRARKTKFVCINDNMDGKRKQRTPAQSGAKRRELRSSFSAHHCSPQIQPPSSYKCSKISTFRTSPSDPDSSCRITSETGTEPQSIVANIIIVMINDTHSFPITQVLTHG
jgi:hypothetical protein